MSEEDINNIYGKSLNLYWDISMILQFSYKSLSGEVLTEMIATSKAIDNLKESIGRNHKINDKILNKPSCDCFNINKV